MNGYESWFEGNRMLDYCLKEMNEMDYGLKEINVNMTKNGGDVKLTDNVMSREMTKILIYNHCFLLGIISVDDLRLSTLYENFANINFLNERNLTLKIF